jgi:TolB-like protein
VIAAVSVIGVGYFAVDRFVLSKRVASGTQALTGQTGAPAQNAIPEKSVAVLPFVDMSQKKDQEYFSDGLTEELIDLLSQVQDLRVPARTSSFFFKGKSEDIATIAQKLRVAHVLEGSVRRFGTHLRVTAQLVRSDTGYHLWSETYDRDADDLFKIQDDIAGSVVKALKVSILNPEVLRHVPTENSEAHALYLHALSLARQSTSADSVQAYKDLRRALNLDPRFALAWSALAQLLTDDTASWWEVFGNTSATIAAPTTRSQWIGLYKEVRNAAHDAASHAVQFGPQLAEAHLAMGLVLYWIDWNWDAAGRELQQAHELDPGNTEITEAAAGLANTLGHFEEGLRLANLAARQDPLGSAYLDIGAAYHRLGKLKEAAAAYQHLTELYPTASAYHFRHALVLLSLGDPQAALAELEHEPAPQYRQVAMPLVLDALGRKAEADRALTVTLTTYSAMAYQLSYVYAARGDHDNAIAWLERALEQRDTGLLSIKDDPMLKGIKSDARFLSLLRKMNLPE